MRAPRLTRTLPSILTFTLAVTAWACGKAAMPASANHALLGQTAPEIKRRATLDGRPLDSVGGRPLVIKFFAEFCEPCKRTLPATQHLHESNPNVLFVGIDEDESQEAARRMVERYGLTFGVVHDPANALSGRFRVSKLPMTFVVDRAGVVRWVGDENQTEDDLQRAVAAVQ